MTGIRGYFPENGFSRALKIGALSVLLLLCACGGGVTSETVTVDGVQQCRNSADGAFAKIDYTPANSAAKSMWCQFSSGVDCRSVSGAQRIRILRKGFIQKRCIVI